MDNPQGAMSLHTVLTDRQMRECTGLVIPERVLLRQERDRQVLDKVNSGKRTWGQVLLGDPLQPARVTRSRQE